jgi:hypothetical protein
LVVCSKCGERNEDGQEFCRNQACGAYLPFVQSDAPAAGGPGPVAPQQPQRAAPPRAPQKRGVRVALSQSIGTVTPGESVATTLTIVNGGTVVEQFETSVTGISPEWVTVQPPVVSLMPGAEAAVAIRLHPVRNFNTSPGRHDFFVSTVSTVSAEASATASGSFEVGTFDGIGVALTPQRSETARRARHRVTVVNDGNAPELMTLEASDPNEALAFRLEEEQFAVEPGEARVVDLGVRPRRLHWFGQPTAYPFNVTARTAADGEHNPAGTFVQKAVLPIWLLAVAGATAVALVAVFQLASRKGQNFNAQPSGQVSPAAASGAGGSGAPSDSSSAPSASSDAGAGAAGAAGAGAAGAGAGGGGGGGGGNNPSAQQSGADKYAKAVLADHPVVFYRFGKDAAADSSGSNNVGNFDGGAQRSSTALLDGSDGSASFPAPSGGSKPSFCVSRPGDLLTDVPFTAEAWIKTTDRDGPIFSLRSMHFASGFDFGVGYSPWSADGQSGHDNNGSVYVWEQGTTPNEATPQQGGDYSGALQFPGVNEPRISANVVDGNFHHVVAVRGTDHSLKIYVDGNQVYGGQKDSFASRVLGDEACIGMEPGYVRPPNYGPQHPSGAEFLTGNIAYVALYNSALSPDAVKNHFNAGHR